jgi:hypothetical protein
VQALRGASRQDATSSRLFFFRIPVVAVARATTRHMATLDFKGKALVQNYHLSVKYHELVPKRDRSLTGKVRLDDNLIIHGDNLKALKALLPTYAGQVKCIYIDPPYNTGNEGWAYNDNVNSPMMQEWLGKAVDREDLTSHDKWLCMMTPRLKLLKELLRDEGVIFISCDDNEAHRLRALMDEIFGEENFVSSIAVKANPRGRQSDQYIATLHDYCICYARNASVLELNGLPLTEEDVEEFDQQDADGKKWRELGLRQRGAASLREDRPDMYFSIFVSPKDGSVSLEKTKLHTVEVLPRKSDGRDSRRLRRLHLEARPRFRVRLVVIVPHRSRICKVKKHPRTHRRNVPVTKNLIVILAMPRRVKSQCSFIYINHPALQKVVPTLGSFISLIFPSGFSNGEHLARRHYLTLRSNTSYSTRDRLRISLAS